MKSKPPLTEKIIPYIIFLIGILYGLGFAIDWDIQIIGQWDVSFETQLETEKSAWDIVAAIGSLLGGGGTIILIFIAAATAKDWKKGIALTKKIERFSLHVNQITKKMDEHDRKIFEEFLFDWSKNFDKDSFDGFKLNAEPLQNNNEEVSSNLFLYGALISQDASRINKLIGHLISDLMEEDIDEGIKKDLKRLQSDVSTGLTSISNEIRSSFPEGKIKKFNKDNLQMLFNYINSYNESKSIFLSKVNRTVETLK